MSFIIKGYVHITKVKPDPVNDDIEFEVLDEVLFHNGFTTSGLSLSQSDIEVYLEYELDSIDWEIEVQEGDVYGVLYEFDLVMVQSYFDDDMEEVIIKNVEFIKIEDELANDMIEFKI